MVILQQHKLKIRVESSFELQLSDARKEVLLTLRIFHSILLSLTDSEQGQHAVTFIIAYYIFTSQGS